MNMTPSPESPLSELVSEHCPVCGASNRKNRVICPACYWSLPLELREGIYKARFADMDSAIERAKAWLEKERKELKGAAHG